MENEIGNKGFAGFTILGLAIKKPPQIAQKKGIEVVIGIDDNKNSNKIIEEGEVVDKLPNNIIAKKTLIKDGRKTSNVNRKEILASLMQNGIVQTRKQTLHPQSRVIEKRIIDNIEPPSVQEIQFETADEIDDEEEDNIIDTLKHKIPDTVTEEDESEDEYTLKKDIPKKSGPYSIKIKRKAVLKTKKNKLIDSNASNDDDFYGDEYELEKRLPKSVVNHQLKTSKFYMQNRKKYLSQLIPLYSSYKQELSNEDAVASCDNMNKKGSSDFKPMIHQKVVTDYLNLYTPYRGLLLYHGLGSGKTCTSISIAEGMKSQKQIFVLTLASLKANFFDQMKVCGDPIYKLDQFWEFLSIDGQPNLIKELSHVLNLTENYVKYHKGAWMINVKKESNFQELDDIDKKSINEQLDAMIRSKYKDINYNGLNKKKMEEMTANYTKNPFDDSVVIIDEVHNFVSRIVNKMNDKTSISYNLYEYLMGAKNARIVLLSGTPIINYPNEIGILFNILRGYIKTWKFPFSVGMNAKSRSLNSVLAWFKSEGIDSYDYIDFSGQNLIITRNPFGFINKHESNQKVKGGKSKKGVIIHKNKRKTMKIMKNKVVGGGQFEDYVGVELDDTGNMSDILFKKKIISVLGKHDLHVVGSKVIVTNNKALPDVSKDFNDMFIELGVKDMKNERVFQKRILGLTSYFKGADSSLYPIFIPSEEDNVYHIERVNMSEYQFGVYENLRDEESKREGNIAKAQRQRNKKQDAAELFKIPSTYRISSRMACNFAFPNPPGRPRINDGDKDEDGDEDDLNEESILKKRGVKPTKGGSDGDEVDLDELSSEEDEETKDELNSLEDKNIEDSKIELEEQTKDIELEEVNAEESKIDDAEINDKLEYSERIQNALNEIKSRSDELLSLSGLQMYSPKFLKILENIKQSENTGLHLIYSQFRSMEGIGIFKMVLEANGFAQLRIRKSGTEWELDETPEEVNKPKFALHTGTETDEEKKIILNIYNSKWGEVPSNIVSVFNARDQEHNHMGEVVRILMITASGAEGINLKNTRYVHIMEPYWNMVRLEQVIGRARRICSHHDLPEDMRTVKVFLYISVLSESQRTDDKHIALRLRDRSKLSSKHSNKSGGNQDDKLDDSTLLGRYVIQLDEKPEVITTDQQLFENALVKDHVNSQILMAVKETAMDCRLYEKQNSDDNIVCFDFGKISSNAFGTLPTIKQDISEKDVVEVREVKSKLITIMFKGVKYALNDRTGELFNMDDITDDMDKNAKLTPIGNKIGKGKTAKIEIFDTSTKL